MLEAFRIFRPFASKNFVLNSECETVEQGSCLWCLVCGQNELDSLNLRYHSSGNRSQILETLS